MLLFCSTSAGSSVRLPDKIRRCWSFSECFRRWLIVFGGWRADSAPAVLFSGAQRILSGFEGARAFSQPVAVRWSTRLRGATDPVTAAALVAFSFVFIHPFEDGNGRIHRFLIHQVLSSEGFTPPDVLFPVSAAIVRDRRGYDAALETFSNAILPFIDWHWTAAKEIVVENETADLYRFFDATPLVEFLYAKTAETVRKDLKEELGFAAVYDDAMTAVRDIVDMPDRRASLLVRLCMQNGGKLSKARRSELAN